MSNGNTFVKTAENCSMVKRMIVLNIFFLFISSHIFAQDGGYLDEEEGFYDFIPQVIKAMNDEEIPMEDRSPETWKRVYRDIVYPKYIGKHKVKPDKKAEKEELKKEASLVKTPGKPEEKKKEEDDTPESYAKWRQKQSFFHNPI